MSIALYVAERTFLAGGASPIYAVSVFDELGLKLLIPVCDAVQQDADLKVLHAGRKPSTPRAGRCLV